MSEDSQGSPGNADELKVGDFFEFESQIGQGTYGKVFRAEPKNENPDGKRFMEPVYAIKNVNLENPTFQREVSLLQGLRHGNVISLKAVFTDLQSKAGYLVLEYAEFDLCRMVNFSRRCRDQGLPVPHVAGMQKSIMLQILKGLSFLHSQKVLHRDLKTDNVLVTGEGPASRRGRVKIADFGVSMKCGRVPVPRGGSVIVSLWNRPPELLLETEFYSFSIDLWAMGCIFAELFLLRPIFHSAAPNMKDSFNYYQLKTVHRLLGNSEGWTGLTRMPKFAQFTGEYARDVNKQTMTTVKDFMRENLAIKFPTASKSEKIEHELAMSLIESLLHPNPAHRISCKDAMNHRFFAVGSAPTDDVFNGQRIPFSSQNQSRQSVPEAINQAVVHNVPVVQQQAEQQQVVHKAYQKHAGHKNVNGNTGVQIGNVDPRSRSNQYVPHGSLMHPGPSAAPPIRPMMAMPPSFAMPGSGLRQPAPYRPVQPMAPLNDMMSSLVIDRRTDIAAPGQRYVGSKAPPGGSQRWDPALPMPSNANTSFKAGPNYRQQKYQHRSAEVLPEQLQPVQFQQRMTMQPPQVNVPLGIHQFTHNLGQQSRIHTWSRNDKIQQQQVPRSQGMMPLPQMNVPLGIVRPNPNFIQQPNVVQQLPTGQGTIPPPKFPPGMQDPNAYYPPQ